MREVTAKKANMDSLGNVVAQSRHIYKQSIRCYPIIAEGDTCDGHIARGRDIMGPCESYEHNPIIKPCSADCFIQHPDYSDLF